MIIMKQRTACPLMNLSKYLPLALFMLVLFCQCATVPPLDQRNSAANFYDDFSGIGIDPSKWVVIGDRFSQPGDGFLHFSATGRTFQMLRSQTVFSSGVFTMSILDYWCDNDAPHSQQLGSIVGLGLGTEGHYVRIERGQVRAGPMGYSSNIGGYLEVNWIVPSEPGSRLHVDASPSAITSGFLQIRYDGTRVSFFYRTSVTQAWTRVGPILTPGWTGPVPIFIQGLPGGTWSDRYTLRFRLDSVEVDPISVSRQ